MYTSGSCNTSDMVRSLYVIRTNSQDVDSLTLVDLRRRVLEGEAFHKVNRHLMDVLEVSQHLEGYV